MQDFKECLEDLEQQVADYTDEIQQLAQYTADSISFEVRKPPSALTMNECQQMCQLTVTANPCRVLWRQLAVCCKVNNCA